MSQAFMREKEEQWLGDVEPNINALMRYLTRENNGIKVTEVKSYFDEERKQQIYEMSNGFCYALDDDKRWQMI
jgi:uncharacterized surface protein with fasciclin (FAS1) repeats